MIGYAQHVTAIKIVRKIMVTFAFFLYSGHVLSVTMVYYDNSYNSKCMLKFIRRNCMKLD